MRVSVWTRSLGIPGLNAQNLVVRHIGGKEDELLQREIFHDKPTLKA